MPRFLPKSFLIESARLSIRPLTDADASDLSKTVSSPRITESVYILRHGLTSAEARDLIRNNSSTNVLCGIWEKPTGPLIGGFRMHRHDDGAVEVGYWLDVDWHGRGLAKEALGRVLSYLMTHHEKSEVVAECDPTNAPSQAILLSNGFQCTGEPGKRPNRKRYRYRPEETRS